MDGHMKPSGRIRYLLDLFLEILPLRLARLDTPSLRCEPRIRVKSPSRLSLGNHVTIQWGSLLHCGGKRWCGYDGGVSLDDHVVIGPGCVVYGAGYIHLGEFTHLGPGVTMVTQSGVDTPERMSPHPRVSLEPITVGRGCWIGAGAVILGGTELGDRCTVAPNSVVRGRYEEGTIIVGNPGRVSRIV